MHVQHKLIAHSAPTISIVRKFWHSYFVINNGEKRIKVEAAGRRTQIAIPPNTIFSHSHTLTGPSKTDILNKLLMRLGKTYGSFYSNKTAVYKAPFFYGNITRVDLNKLLWQLPFYQHALQVKETNVDNYRLISARFLSKKNPFPFNICSQFVHRFLFGATLIDQINTTSEKPQWMRQLEQLINDASEELTKIHAESINDWINPIMNYLDNTDTDKANFIQVIKQRIPTSKSRQKLIRRIQQNRIRNINQIIDAIPFPHKNQLYSQHKLAFNTFVSDYYPEIISYFKSTGHKGLVKQAKPFRILSQFRKE